MSRLNTVTFQLPDCSSTPPRQRAVTAPVQSSYRYSLNPPTSKDLSSANSKSDITSSPATTENNTTSPKISLQPDLIADIVQRPSTADQLRSDDQNDNHSVDGTGINAAIPPKTENEEIESDTIEPTSPASPLPPGAEKGGKESPKTKQDQTSTQRGGPRSSKGGRSSSTGKLPVYKITKSQQARKTSYQIRENTNFASHDHIRLMKYDVAKLREHLVKLEEEVKHAARGKSLLGLGIQDIRKCLSVNQQSISTQQKKSKREGEDPTLQLLEEESHVLSRSKRRIEHHLVTIKTHLQTLDSMRRTLKSKIALLSRALGLDAQNFKVYNGPVIVRAESISKQRHYSNACIPPARTEIEEGDEGGDEGVAQMCSEVMEVISASRAVRGEIKSIITSIRNNMAEAHQKITELVAKKVEDTKLHQRELMLQKGKVRIEQNSINHQKHYEEIALGIAMGPISDKYRSVSEKQDRPLSRLRSESAVMEHSSYKETTNHITRQLSASTVRASQAANTDLKLEREIQADSQSAIIDSKTLRVRKASLDNRWVES